MPNREAHTFVTVLHADDSGATVEAAPRPPLSVGAPPEYGGTEDVWSPEHLLLASVSACFWTTLQAIAQRKGIPVHRLACRASGEVAKTAEGQMFTAIALAVDLEVAPSVFPEADRLVESAKRWCLVTNSLRCPVTVTSIVTTTAHVSAEGDEPTSSPES